MRPDRLVVGECRGEELRELLMALNTGHDGGAGTLHASGLTDVAARLEALGALAGMDAVATARQTVSAIDAVVHVERVDGRRRSDRLGAPRRSRGRITIEPERWSENPRARRPRRPVRRIRSRPSCASRVLLSAGLTPASAWRHLADTGDPVCRAAAHAAAGGDDVGAVLAAAEGSWADVAAIWSVAVHTGAPLADTLRAVGGALRDATEVVARCERRTRGARRHGQAPGVVARPGRADGDGPRVRLRRHPGLRPGGYRLPRIGHPSARDRPVVVATAHAPRSSAHGGPGLRAELWAVALSGGVSADRARSLVDTAFGSHPADGSPDDAAQTVAFADRAGVPAAELLRADAWLADSAHGQRGAPRRHGCRRGCCSRSGSARFPRSSSRCRPDDARHPEVRALP